MDFAYYIVRKKDMTILDGTSDMVSAINVGQKQGCACLILQACIITEVGQDMVEESQDSVLQTESEITESEDVKSM